jgi:hypothetical protein
LFTVLMSSNYYEENDDGYDDEWFRDEEDFEGLQLEEARRRASEGAMPAAQ